LIEGRIEYCGITQFFNTEENLLFLDSQNLSGFDNFVEIIYTESSDSKWQPRTGRRSANNHLL